MSRRFKEVRGPSNARSPESKKHISSARLPTAVPAQSAGEVGWRLRRAPTVPAHDALCVAMITCRGLGNAAHLDWLVRTQQQGQANVHNAALCCAVNLFREATCQGAKLAAASAMCAGTGGSTHHPNETHVGALAKREPSDCRKEFCRQFRLTLVVHAACTSRAEGPP